MVFVSDLSVEEKHEIGDSITCLNGDKLVGLLQLIKGTDSDSLINNGNDWDFDLQKLSTQVIIQI